MEDEQNILEQTLTAILGSWQRDDAVLCVFFAKLSLNNKRAVAEFFAPANRNELFGNFEYEIFIKDKQVHINFIDLQQNEIKEYGVLQLEAGKILQIKSSEGIIYNFTPCN